MSDQSRASRVGNMFPQKPQFSGFMKPCRFEGEIQNLEVWGEIPHEIHGTFYRVMPDPQFPPFAENDPWFNGDGNVSAFRIKDGRCHFKQRYVVTEKFAREREAQRALIGTYRNKYTDAVEFKVRSTANTNIVFFNGRLLACKEDSPPYSLDPVTLETIGLELFNGRLPCLTFTAHPKLDEETNELICFGYEAKGDGTPDVCYFTIDAQGKFTQTMWLVAPVVAMIHDFAFTKNWVLFPIIPQTCELERMKQGGEHWQWDPNIPFYLGVLPRHGALGSDVKWFRAPNAFPGHTVNAYEDDLGNIVFDLPLTNKNAFFWWPDANGNAPQPEQIAAELVRFTFDPKSTDLDLPKPLVIGHEDCEFPRIDDRFFGKMHSHAFMDIMDPNLGTDFAAIAPVMGGGYPPYNSIGHLDYSTMRMEKYFPGRTHLVQEPVCIARHHASEGDGWIMALVNNYSTMSSELHIVSTRQFEKAQAIIYLPLRLRAGLHGNWVNGQDIRCSK
ncbi:carotenoid oxygenase [Bipolaris maydis]|nr:carotenoid oxygenase [Bipolaris maydis]KAJ5056332.1 carotenoid oxygenase [Bipolaris maydis]